MENANFRQALIVIDQAPLYEDALDDCRRASLALQALKVELDRHTSLDIPAYERWLNSTFGGYMTAIREASARLQELETELGALRQRKWAEFFGSDCPHHSEGGIGRDRDHDDDAGSARNGARAIDPDEFWDENFEEYVSEASDFYAQDETEYGDEESTRQFEEYIRRGGGAYRSSGYKSRGFHEQDDRSGPRRFKSEEEARKQNARKRVPGVDIPLDPQSRLKERYRLLVKKLHPDLNPDLTPEKKRLWNQVQAAYRDRDLEQMDLLIALSDVFSGVLSESTSLHQLRLATVELGRALAPVQKEINEAKQHRAWRFSELGDRMPLQRLIEREYHRDLAHLRQALGKLEIQLARFKQPGRRAESPLVDEARA